MIATFKEYMMNNIDEKSEKLYEQLNQIIINYIFNENESWENSAKICLKATATLFSKTLAILSLEKHQIAPLLKSLIEPIENAWEEYTAIRKELH